MYLSKLLLNPRSRQANIDKGNPYELHRTLMCAFPPFDHEVVRILYRLDGKRLDQLLVQSTLEPNWSTLQNDYLLTQPQMKMLEHFSFKPGQILRFRLRANPTKRDPRNHKRIGLYKEEERINWIRRKGELHGFSFQDENLILSSTFWREFNLPSKKDNQKHRSTFNFVDFNGLLTVENPDSLNAAVRQGIGPAKSFGCGLLSLARL